MSDVVFEQEQFVRCPECNAVFSFKVELKETHFEKELFIDVDCSECKSELVVNFEPYLVADTPVYKSTGASGNAGNAGLTLNLPDEVLARKR